MPALREALIDTPIGPLRARARGAALVALHLPGLGDDTPTRAADADDPLIAKLRSQLEEYFAGQRTCFELPLAFEGTEFQRSVWRALLAIEAGATRSYGDIARQVGSHARAVGHANARNPIAIIVPCHRVIGADGSLTGYAGGLRTKRWLLHHEGVAVDHERRAVTT